MKNLMKRLAWFLFDEYVRDLVDEYVYRERAKWQERFDHERRISADLQRRNDMLMRIRMESSFVDLSKYMFPVDPSVLAPKTKA